jgi:NADH-quinone oxidoreductase subunit E
MDFSKLDSILRDYENDYTGSLITILQQTQEEYGWLSRESLVYISEKTSVPLSKINGVATFYAQFRDKPVGKYLISLCRGTACHVNGSAAIERSIREFVGAGEGEVSADGLFTYNNVACLGCCSLSPAMLITSSNGGGGKTYGKLTGESAIEILKGMSRADRVSLSRGGLRQ